MLMRYLNNFLEREVADLHKNNVRFIRIGLDEPLPQYLRQKIKEAELKTRNNTGLTAVLALNYGSRQEIVEAARRFASCVCAGKAKIEGLNTQNFSDYFYTCGLPDPDLLIRTSGEMRLSNFLLWQLSYAELYFPRKYWPDFRAKDLEEAVKEFQQRERRFGGIESVKKDN
jgi:undecaprenyl diphosphate synthase